jgi:hypothetical protein
MYCDRPFDELKTAAKAALEHHFNNHEFCGGWCLYLAKSEAERAEVQYNTVDEKLPNGRSTYQIGYQTSVLFGNALPYGNPIR